MYLFTFKFSTLASPTKGHGTAWERIQARGIKQATLALYRKRPDIDQVLGVIQEKLKA